MKHRKTKRKKMSLRDKAVTAMQEAVAAVIEDHRRRNAPLAIWQDGKVVMLPPDQFPVFRNSSRVNSVVNFRHKKV
jgi:hypothetical protein